MNSRDAVATIGAVGGSNSVNDCCDGVAIIHSPYSTRSFAHARSAVNVLVATGGVELSGLRSSPGPRSRPRLGLGVPFHDGQQESLQRFDRVR